MAERGHSLESIKASIEARKPDFDAYIGTIPISSSACSWVYHRFLYTLHPQLSCCSNRWLFQFLNANLMFYIYIVRSTEAICWCCDWSIANTADSWWQWRKGFKSKVDNERGSEEFQPCLPVWWRLYYLMDSLWKEVDMFLPWHQILLWPWHLLWQWGIYLPYFNILPKTNLVFKNLSLTRTRDLFSYI